MLGINETANTIVDGIIAYVENRDGNTPVKFHQADTLSRAFSLLHSNGLHVGVFRADSGSYSEDIVRTVDGNCRVFYIRASNSASMYSSIQNVKEWKRIEIGSQETEVASFGVHTSWTTRTIALSSSVHAETVPKQQNRAIGKLPRHSVSANGAEERDRERAAKW